MFRLKPTPHDDGGFELSDFDHLLYSRGFARMDVCLFALALPYSLYSLFFLLDCSPANSPATPILYPVM